MHKSVNTLAAGCVDLRPAKSSTSAMWSVFEPSLRQSDCFGKFGGACISETGCWRDFCGFHGIFRVASSLMMSLHTVFVLSRLVCGALVFSERLPRFSSVNVLSVSVFLCALRLVPLSPGAPLLGASGCLGSSDSCGAILAEGVSPCVQLCDLPLLPLVFTLGEPVGLPLGLYHCGSFPSFFLLHWWNIVE